MDIEELSERVAELDPNCAAGEVRRRATLLAAMIEGLVIVRGAHSASPQVGRVCMFNHTGSTCATSIDGRVTAMPAVVAGHFNQ